MTTQEMMSKLGFRVSKTTTYDHNRAENVERVLVHHKSGVYVGDSAHWKMWLMLTEGESNGS